MSEQKKQMTALERIQNLENGFMGVFSNMDAVSRDVLLIKEAIKLLANKVDAMANLNVQGEAMTDENINKIMIANNEKELKSKVDNYINQGVLESSDIVDDNSFVVGQELDADGKVVNPRIQFTVSSFNEESRAKLSGLKLGDMVDLEDNGLKMSITEIYKVKDLEQSQQNTKG